MAQRRGMSAVLIYNAARGLRSSCQRGRKMNETESRTSESSNHVLFPMAVGVLFLAVLVAGALLG